MGKKLANVGPHMEELRKWIKVINGLSRVNVKFKVEDQDLH